MGIYFFKFRMHFKCRDSTEKKERENERLSNGAGQVFLPATPRWHERENRTTLVEY